jgi:hypothetical protein
MRRDDERRGRFRVTPAGFVWKTDFMKYEKD